MKLVVLFVSVAVLVVEGRECPTHCLCYQWEGLSRTDCVRKNLFNTFVGFSHETQVLDLSHNVISILHGNEFLDANLRRLQDLRLANNRLHKIDKLSFNGLEVLECVDLSFNSIEYLPPNAFEYNPNLKLLNVSHNRLKPTKDEPFLSNAPALRVLDLAHCLFTFIGVLFVADLSGLQVLNMTHNYVARIQSGAFEGLKNLRHVDFTKNDLPCNAQMTDLLRGLLDRGIRFQAVCQTSQRMMVSETQTNHSTRFAGKLHRKKPDHEEKAIVAFNEDKTAVDVFAKFFQSIPPYYVALGGLQAGILIGVIVTCLWTRKRARSRRDEEGGLERTRPTRFIQGNSDLTSALIPLNKPPGTPPSPYRSRLAFPSTFSLPAT